MRLGVGMLVVEGGVAPRAASFLLRSEMNRGAGE
jgi:hypothetical protein